MTKRATRTSGAKLISFAPRPSTATDDVLTLDDALAILGGPRPVPRSTFFRWKALGKAPRTIKYPNGSLHVRRSDLDAWLIDHEEDAAA